MPRLYSIKYTPLRTCLINLPMSLYGPLAAKQVRPQRLAVHIALPGASKGVYVGWTGMASASSLSKWQHGAQAAAEALDTIEIDPQVAQSYGFKDGATVEIGLVHNLPIATNVETEPLSADDWEILETHADYVEQNLLGQVRAAAVGQEISVWALGRSRVQFRVVSIKPEGQAVLLGPDTEVAIAPKLRPPPKPSSAQSKKPLQNQSTDLPTSPDSSIKATDSAPLSLRVFPVRLLVSPINTDSEVEVHLSNDDIQKLNSQSNKTSCTYAWLVRVRPPRLVKEFDKRGKPVEKSGPAPVLLQQNKQKDKHVEGEKPVPGVLVRIKANEEIIAGHAVVIGLENKVEEWDTVLLSPSDEPEQPSRSSSPKQITPPDVRPAQDEKSELAGVDTILADCHNFFVRTFMQNEAFGTAGGSHLPGLLLHGAPGSGRTSVARAVTKELESDPSIHACIVYVDLAQLADQHTSVLRDKFKTWRTVAAWRQPSVLVLDNLDKVVSAEVEHADSSRARHLAEHFLDIFVESPAPGVALLATCQGPTALHPLLTTSHVFSHKVQLRAPDKAARRDIISRIVDRRLATSDLSSDPAKPLNFVALATDTEGYSATDLQDLVGRAVHAAAVRSAADNTSSAPVLLPADFSKAQEDFVPLTLRGVKLQKSEVSWSDIGGLHETRRVLRETLEWPTKYGAIFAKCPLRLRSGLLLYGYPGCGKTLLASAVAKECGLNFISVKGPELLNKYIGQSEQSVRDIFDRASAAKPCVLFLDEFDSIAPKRGHDSTGVTDRVVNQMLTQMDGAEGLDGVYVLAATSRPDLIDPALLRPGRLDKSLLCHMPDVDERREILEAVSRKIALAPNVDLNQIARQTEGFSGADLQALVYNAQLEVVHEELASKSQELTESLSTERNEDRVRVEVVGGAVMTRAETAALERRVATMIATRAPKSARKKVGASGEKPRHQITLAHLERSLENHRPSVSPEERWRLQMIYDAFQSDRTGEHKVPPGLSGVGERATLG
ncbi:Peroxisome biosynthesis protein PAS1 OS=Komagataella pastoris GN=PEX1 PE=3 SV=1 [Rhizoctonia solani AG-1 IB]|uniref:Peroxisomal ATPase PEX1 n=3 Tax=Rhizoctonia solani TaxID=456999 RepID=A0A0B7FET0_THACB|nr:Peroxisome biosynthesis protein PAS1 OS=Komagataella pastoris GN=PEX1 PE=3 SV=1 [Rhizoctonia solani AG-1 IB]